MKRIRLSNSLIIAKIVLVFILIWLGKMVEFLNAEVLILVIIILGFILYRTFYLPHKIEFDDDYMYVNRKDGKQEVNLKNVICVARTRFSIRNNLYKVKYYYKGDEYIARFYPRYFSTSLDKFKDAVVKKNPDAEVNLFWLF
jgi:hypothetical protein